MQFVVPEVGEEVGLASDLELHAFTKRLSLRVQLSIGGRSSWELNTDGSFAFVKGVILSFLSPNQKICWELYTGLQRHVCDDV